MSTPIVLCYHAVSRDWEDGLAVRAEQLHVQLSALAARGYRSVTFTDIATRRHPDRVVCVTFDDAFQSVYRHALPVLRALGYVATVFVPTSFISPSRPLLWPGFDEQRAAPEAERTPMCWDELRTLRSAGWEIGSHTRTHARLPRVDDATLAAELRMSRDELEAELGVPVTALAYPYGDVDERVRAAAASAGYLAAATLGPQKHRAEPLWWPRVGVYRPDTPPRFRLKTVRLLRGSAAAALIDSIRTAVSP